MLICPFFMEANFVSLPFITQVEHPGPSKLSLCGKGPALERPLRAGLKASGTGYKAKTIKRTFYYSHALRLTPYTSFELDLLQGTTFQAF